MRNLKGLIALPMFLLVSAGFAHADIIGSYFLIPPVQFFGQIGASTISAPGTYTIGPTTVTLSYHDGEASISGSGSTPYHGANEGGSAGVTYYFEVFGSKSEQVPLIFTGSGSTSISSITYPGTGDFEGTQFAIAGYNLPLGLGLPEYRGGYEDLINTCSGSGGAIPGITCQNQNSFSFSLSADATPGTIYEIDVSAGGSAVFVGSWAASVDPQVEIDPSFADASDFTLEFSPNPPSAVPEPSSMPLLLLVCLGVGALLWFRSARARRVRVL
jgi:hypothetical protein